MRKRSKRLSKNNHLKRSYKKRTRRQRGGRLIKIFNLDLHISVIEDVRTILDKLYKNRYELTDWSISGDAYRVKKKAADVKIINADTWRNIDMEMIKNFQTEYDSLLSSYDVFIVTHTPVFAMLYEKYNKPIIVVNSCRYDQPFCWNKNKDMLNKFHESLKRMSESKQMTIISNNLADQLYLKEGAGIESMYLPSICMYTEATYNPIKETYVSFEKGIFDKFKAIPNSEMLLDRPPNYTFKDLFEYKGIVHMPYDISSMSLFEQFFAGVPLFFPEKNFYKECIKNKVTQFIVRYDMLDDIIAGKAIVPDNEIDKWLANADYYNFKYINYYTSFKDGIDKLRSFSDTDKEARLAHIQTVKDDVISKWKNIFDKIFKEQSGGRRTHV
jgi:hypothetical protein